MERLLKTISTHEYDENYPKDVVHIYADNEYAMKMTEAVLNDLLGELCSTEANDKVLDIWRFPVALIQAAQNHKQTNTGVLANLFKFKIGAKIMLTVNVDIQDRLINCQTRNVRHIEFAKGSILKVYVKCSDEQAGLKAMRPSYLCRQNVWVPIEKCETGISKKKGLTCPLTKHTKFPLTLARASTVHKIQSLTKNKVFLTLICGSKNHFDQAKCILHLVG